MDRKFVLLATVITLMFVVVGLGSSVAQSTLPPTERARIFDDTGFRKAVPAVAGGVTETTSGSDSFGYTWESEQPLGWIDATTGTNTGLSGFSGGQYVGPIPLPFAFDYYENRYGELFINAGGYITFSEREADGYNPGGRNFPETNWPNDIIAPLWSIYELADSGSTNRIYYKSGGSAPNRYFVVEWHAVEMTWQPSSGQGVLTFEVILFESGDIQFQYQQLDTSGGFYCDYVRSGMEDSRGGDGLSTVDWCKAPKSFTATHIDRPPDTARILLEKPFMGSFISQNRAERTPISVINNGTLGADVYNLSVSSGWPVSFFDARYLPLQDSNGDGKIDTGPIAQGATQTIYVQVSPPAIVNPADEARISITFTSAKNANVSEVQTIERVTSLPFAQAYGPQGRIQLNSPANQIDQQINEQGYEDFAVAETPSGDFVYSSTQYGETEGDDPRSFSEIIYKHLNAEGEQKYTFKKLTNHNTATLDTYDWEPTLAVAPNGTTGILWVRDRINADRDRNTNIFFASIDPAGNINYGPENITDNEVFSGWYDEDTVLIGNPDIAATADNHFVLTWTSKRYFGDDGHLGPVMYQVRQSNGVVTRDTDLLTGVIPSTGQGIGALSGNRVAVAVPWFDDGSGTHHVDFFILGGPDWAATYIDNIAAEVGSGTVYNADVAQFGNGNIIVGWNYRGSSDESVGQYTFLNSSNARMFAPKTLSHPAMRVGSNSLVNLSLTAAGPDNVVATWQDPIFNASQNLYYAALNPDGTFLSGPAVFASDENDITAGLGGYSNTTITINPTATGVDSFIQAPTDLTATANQITTVPVVFGNTGTATATAVTVSTTIAAGLTYAGDDSGVTPTALVVRHSEQEATLLTWAFNEQMEFMANGRFNLFLTAENAELDTSYTVTTSIGTTQPDANPGNNEASISVIKLTDRFTLLPAILQVETR